MGVWVLRTMMLGYLVGNSEDFNDVYIVGFDRHGFYHFML
jgi:valyl-tRNA synthetase